MMQDFFKGITAYGKAFRLISKMKLWAYVVAPGVISLALGLLTFASAWGFSDNLGDILFSWYPWELGRNFFSGLSQIVGGILIGIIGIIGFKHIILVLVSPFMSPLSEKIEAQMLGKSIEKTQINRSKTKALKDMYRGMRVALRNIIRELFYTLILIILGGMIPIVGVFSTVLIFFVQAYYAGFGNMDYTLERHYGVKDSAKFVKRNRMLALGNGTVFLGLVVSIVGLLIAPTLATIAATMETVPRLGKVPLPKEDSNREEFV